jgi:ATP-dependent Clp protease ATP-binding subunit ClpA
MVEVNVPMTTRDALKQARELASELNSRTVEAEHLLVVLADPSAETAKILQEAGLDRSRIEAALREENRVSLAVAGVEPLTNDQASASRHTRTPQWGASAKVALARGHHIAKDSGRVWESTTDLESAPIGKP